MQGIMFKVILFQRALALKDCNYCNQQQEHLLQHDMDLGVWHRLTNAQHLALWRAFVHAHASVACPMILHAGLKLGRRHSVTRQAKRNRNNPSHGISAKRVESSTASLQSCYTSMSSCERCFLTQTMHAYLMHRLIIVSSNWLVH